MFLRPKRDLTTPAYSLCQSAPLLHEVQVQGPHGPWHTLGLFLFHRPCAEFHSPVMLSVHISHVHLLLLVQVVGGMSPSQGFPLDSGPVTFHNTPWYLTSQCIICLFSKKKKKKPVSSLRAGVLSAFLQRDLPGTRVRKDITHQ